MAWRENLGIKNSLYVVFLIPIFPCLIRLILFLVVFKFETPKFYIMNN